MTPQLCAKKQKNPMCSSGEKHQTTGKRSEGILQEPHFVDPKTILSHTWKLKKKLKKGLKSQ